ncbi:MAG: ABC transporter substrate-binding protein [Alphaproteobacteria bacterium]|nr:ABC transporter substrate-binding protein [Alphaproteobacteria bacterium]
MKKINWKVIVVCVVVALIAGFIICSNMKEQKALQESGKRNVYAVLPLSGPLAVWGKQAQETIDYYLKKNPDAPMNLIYIDSEGNPSKALTALQSKILDEKNPIVISAVSSISAALLPFLDQHGGFNVSMYTKVSPATATYKNQQRISFPILTEMGEKLIDYMNKHYKTMAIFYSEDELGRLGLNAMKEVFKGEVIGAYSFSVAERDVRNTVVKALATNPDAVFVISPPSIGYRNVINELGTAGYQGGILTNQGYQVTWVFQNLEGMDNVMFPCYDILLDENTSEKRKQVMAELSAEGLDLNCLRIEPYNAVAFVDYMLKHNIPFERSEILKMKTFEGIAGPITFTEDGDAEFELGFCTIKDGKIVSMEIEEK